jgi:hypothetical protein
MSTTTETWAAATHRVRWSAAAKTGAATHHVRCSTSAKMATAAQSTRCSSSDVNSPSASAAASSWRSCVSSASESGCQSNNGTNS